MAKTAFKGTPVTLAGEFVKVGTPAPEFTLVKGDLSNYTLKDGKGKYLVLNIFPSMEIQSIGSQPPECDGTGHLKRFAFRTGTLLYHRRHRQRRSLVRLPIYFRFRTEIRRTDDRRTFGRTSGPLGSGHQPGRQSGIYGISTRNHSRTQLRSSPESCGVK